jgi:hypothetical protein
MHILEVAVITNLRQPKPYDYSSMEAPSFGKWGVMRLSAAIAVVVLSVLALSVTSPAASGGFYRAQADKSCGTPL